MTPTTLEKNRGHGTPCGGHHIGDGSAFQNKSPKRLRSTTERRRLAAKQFRGMAGEAKLYAQSVDLRK